MAHQNQSWHITEDEAEVPVRIVSQTSEKNTVRPVSRKPAAIVGIVLATAIGALFTFDKSDFEFMGQVTPEQTIRITNSGLEPQLVTVEPGETITWINEQQIPHYLVSDTLCSSGDTNCMSTETAFQGQEITYTIPTNIAAGAYTYFSPTDTNIIGTISITGASGTPQATPTPDTNVCYSPSDCATPKFCSSLQDGIVPGTCIESQPVVQTTPTSSDTTSDSNPTVADSTTTETISDPVPTNPLLEAIQRQLALDQGATNQNTTGNNTVGTNAPLAIPGLPQNPYTVSNPDTGPPPIVGGVQASTTVQMPFSQPQTGLGSWMIGVVALGSLWFVRKRMNAFEVRQ